MIGTTAQLVALACHFNALSYGGQFAAPFASNSTLQFCEHVRFFRPKGSADPTRTSSWELVANTADEWLTRESRPAKKAFVRHQSVDDPRFTDRMAAGFIGGGGSWRLFTSDGTQTEVWQADWEVGNKNAVDRRIWRVSYRLIAEAAQSLRPQVRSPETIAPVLLQKLKEILTFSEAHQLVGFSACFDRAIRCLAAEDPSEIVSQKDLAPEGVLDLPAKRVLCACQAAWVFAGMGSWNDLSFEGDEQSRYSSLSASLFGLLNEAIVAATNASADLKS